MRSMQLFLFSLYQFSSQYFGIDVSVVELSFKFGENALLYMAYMRR